MAHEDDDLVSVLKTVSKRSPASEVVSPAPAPIAPVSVPADSAVESPAPAVPAAPNLFDYAALLLKVNRNKKGKGIQLDPDNHRTLCYIAHMMGGIAVSDLLQNIVRLHFQQYSAQIQDMLKKKEQLNKKAPLLFQQS